jgi:chemotaxis signal transduction protein
VRTMVHFLTGDGRYCVPVESTVGVRSAAGLLPLPAGRPGVIGVLPADPPLAVLTVLSVLGSGRDRILVLEAVGSTFGLLVEDVTGLSSIDDSEIGSPPDGQDEALVCGIIPGAQGLVFLADPAALAKRL